MVEQTRIDGNQRPERRPALRLNQIEQRSRFPVVAAGTVGFKLHQPPELFGAPGILQIVDRNTEADEIFRRKVNPSQSGVFANVTQDVSELKRDTAFLGQRKSVGRGEAEYVYGGEADHGGYSIAVLVELVERCDGAGLKIGSDPLDHFVEILVRDRIALHRIEKYRPDDVGIGDRKS